MQFEAKVIADSLSPDGVRLTTMELVYPRFIHSEFLTHRTMSRNSSSSRAIPVAKMLEQVRTAPAMPVHWGKNQPGMQANEELDEISRQSAMIMWHEAARKAAEVAEHMSKLGVHKQVANRILEPFQWMHTIVTATEWDNFFALRCHPDAQPEIQKLAVLMREAREGSKPKELEPGQWHLPYVDAQIHDDGEQSYTHWLTAPPKPGHFDLATAEAVGSQFIGLAQALQASSARCARVSYLTHDGQIPDLDKDIQLFERLVGSTPMHASPTEHQATPDTGSGQGATFPGTHGNLTGWCQLRKFLEVGITPAKIESDLLPVMRLSGRSGRAVPRAA